MIKYQNYSHYKLPITMDPLKYGKLIEQIGNKFIITLTTPTNIAVIKQINNENFISIFLSLLIIRVFEFIYSDLGLITSFLPGIRFYSKKENIIKLRRLTSKH